LPPAIIGMSKGINVICIAGGHMEGTVLAGGQLAAGFPEIGDLGVILRQFGAGHQRAGNRVHHDVILRDCIEQYGLQKEITSAIVGGPGDRAMVRHDMAAAVGTPAWLSRSTGSQAVRSLRVGCGQITRPGSWLIEVLEQKREIVERFLVLLRQPFIRREPLQAARLIAVRQRCR
jgi:NitT/TauT family transport system substrate-binding protein